MRGKAAAGQLQHPAPGITPAYAGKSSVGPRLFSMYWDHPRVCGEKVWSLTFHDLCRGSPPRMRGKARPMPLYSVPGRITPAYAGKSYFFIIWVVKPEDHPRVCGEKELAGIFVEVGQGSPPRMRGKVGFAFLLLLLDRITPAYAGKSFPACMQCYNWRDHPRVCGEKPESVKQVENNLGSPPRMRGKVDSCDRNI